MRYDTKSYQLVDLLLQQRSETQGSQLFPLLYLFPAVKYRTFFSKTM